MAINNAINQYPIVDALLGSWTPGAGTITSADSILTAMQKISGSSVSLSGNNVWTGTNSFGNTVTFSTLTASTVPYLDASKNLTSSAVTPTELGYVSGVTSAIQTQLGTKVNLDQTVGQTIGATGARLTMLWATDITVTNAITGSVTGNAGTVTTNANLTGPITSVGNATSIASQTGTGTTFAMSANPTFTGTAVFDRIDANTLHAVGSGGLLVEANNGTDVALFGAGGSSGVTFYGGVNVAGSLLFTSSVVNVLATNTSDGSDDKAITIAGGGAYGPTRGSGIAIIGNEYATIGGDLELMAGDSAISGMIKFYVGDGAGNALLAGSIARTSMLATFNGAVVANSTLSVVSTLTVGGQATATSVGMEIGNTAGGTPFIDFKSSAVDYNVRIINGTSTTLSFLGATGGYFFDTTVNSIYAKVATTANATLTTITQALTIAGNLVTSAYVADGYTAGLTWSSTDDNASKPKAGVFSKTTGAGTYLYFGTSNSYATGITTSSSIGPNGELEIGSITSAGKIQVGSTAPTFSAGSALTINTDVTTGAAGSASLMIQGSSNKERLVMVSAGGGAFINMFSHAGSIASPTATQNGYIISGLSGGGYKATGYSGNQYVFLQYATENWTDTATGCYTAFFTVPNGSTSLTGRLLINHDGSVTLGSSFGTGTGALYAGATQVTSLQCDSITNDTGLAAGTYTPTLTNTTNISASTAYECQYMRVGNTVTVSGKVDVDPTSATTTTVLGISLPVASNFGTAQDCAGAGASVQFAGKSVGIYADTTNDRATMEWINDANVANQSLFFTFTYQVI